MSIRYMLKQRRRNIIVAVALGVIAIALGMVLSLGGLGVIPSRDLRGLAKSIVFNTYNPWNNTLTSYSLNAVASIIWDYRGLDTFFETCVLLSAITGVTVLFRGALEEKGLKRKGMTPIVKSSTKIIIFLTVLVATSIAVHGHLTPGGGFQAGSIAAATVALIVTVYSIQFLYDIGLKKDVLLKIRYIALVAMFLVALIPLTSIALNTDAYILQNQVKEGSRFSMPSHLFNTPLAGTIFIYNLLESVAVASALSYALILFARRREELKIVHIHRGEET